MLMEIERSICKICKKDYTEMLTEELRETFKMNPVCYHCEYDYVDPKKWYSKVKLSWKEFHKKLEGGK